MELMISHLNKTLTIPVEDAPVFKDPTDKCFKTLYPPADSALQLAIAVMSNLRGVN